MDHTKLYDLKDYIPSTMITELNSYILHNIKWNWKIPGGQLRYHPPRKVNSIGNGSAISKDGKLLKGGWDNTFYTSSQNSSNITLKTPSEKMPPIFCKLVPHLRQMFTDSYPDVKTTNYSFVIAVCNYYSEREHHISAHTDDNRWYPHECSKGPVLASLTLYPHSKPQNPNEFANFQVREKKGDKWDTIRMPHNSILIMPTNLEHRVTKAKKNITFRPRINITFRSIFPVYTNPMMNIMAVSNHNRYYRNPTKIITDSKNVTTATEIKKIYDKFLLENGYSPLRILVFTDKNKDKKKLWKSYQQYEILYNFNTTKNQAIIVIETVKIILKWIKFNKITLDTRKNITDFCSNPTKHQFTNFPKKLQNHLIKLAQHCLKNNIGNIALAKNIISNI
jgi:hypothetical protein